MQQRKESESRVIFVLHFDEQIQKIPTLLFGIKSEMKVKKIDPFIYRKYVTTYWERLEKNLWRKKYKKQKKKILLHAILVRRPPPPKSRFQSFCRKQNLLWNVPVLQQCCKTCKTSRFDRISFLGGVNWAPPRECVFLSFKIIVFSNQ